MAGLGAPIFDPCLTAAGGAPVDAAERRRVLRAAVRQAIELANNAADKIDAAIKVAPLDRDPVAKQTAHRFRFFFGHDPARPMARNEESGVSIAARFRSVAKELNGGRRVIFHCRRTEVGCRNDDSTCCDSNTNAFFFPPDALNPDLLSTVNLCESFWNPTTRRQGLPIETFRAAIIIHEMLHMLFEDLRDVGHGRVRAACYEAFALRVKGFGADSVDVCECRGTCRPTLPDWQP